MTELGDLAPPIVSAATGLHGHRAGRQRGQERQKLAAAQPLAKHNSSRAVSPMELKDGLGEIESDGARRVHGCLLAWPAAPSLWHTRSGRWRMRLARSRAGTPSRMRPSGIRNAGPPALRTAGLTFADRPVPFVDPFKGVGRNDPCPCGSG